jgi:predicted flap endonuclease-1-like 5' DNA nuclease
MPSLFPALFLLGLLHDVRRVVQQQGYPRLDLEQELQQVQRRYENLKSESDAIRTTAEKLKEELAKQKAQPVISPAIVTHSLPEKDRSRFTPSTTQTRNDLTKISGIGPAIQKKLNALGIYTFQQINELTPEMIDRIAASLKSFPDRIGRDNWIGQAAALARHKK